MQSDARVRTTDQRARPFARAALAALVFATLAAVVPARAAVMSTTPQTRTVPMTQTNWGPGTPPSLLAPEFDKFDPALGTLLSVQVALGYDFTHDISLTFTSPSTLTESTKDSQVVVNDPNGRLLLSGVPAPVTQSRFDFDGPFPNTVTIPTITQNGSSGPLSLTSPADLALFTAAPGDAKISLPVLAQSNSEFFSSTGNGSGRITTSAGATVTLSYNYVPIPEPSTLAVVGLGGAVLMAWRRRVAER